MAKLNHTQLAIQLAMGVGAHPASLDPYLLGPQHVTFWMRRKKRLVLKSKNLIFDKNIWSEVENCQDFGQKLKIVKILGRN